MSMPEWLFEEAIGKKLNNRSKRIVELIIKGYMAEKIEKERIKVSQTPVEQAKGLNPTRENYFSYIHKPNSLIRAFSEFIS